MNILSDAVESTPATKARRYPGAPPFEDTPLAQQLFFGRPAEKVALANRIMANRLVVFYGRSGLGKTSLLNAGVAPLLRDEGFFPVWVRFNVTGKDPIQLVLDAVRRSAAQHGLEYVPRLTNSLWHYFKTVQLWRGDVLLTPVLILDQFEEVFTLLEAEQRDILIAALAFLIRGVQPPLSAASDVSSVPEDDPSVRLSEKPPALAVVIAIREDFLGSLEELSERVPQVLDQRFRLMPLDRASARQAIESPAVVEALGLMTRPFRFETAAIESILDFLGRQSEGGGHVGPQQMEPFQLQLVCQWIEEKIAAKAQASQQQALTVTVADVGGTKNLQGILQKFYARQLQGFPGPVKRAVRRLCEDRLISPERRRLSLDGEEILRSSRIDDSTLAKLIDGRLLRADRRAGGTYYELSHDTLIAPILRTRRMRSVLQGGFQLPTGGLAVLLGVWGLLAMGLELIAYPLKRLGLVKQGLNYVELNSAAEVTYGLIILILFVSLVFAGKATSARGWDLICQFSGPPSTRTLKWSAAVLGLFAVSCLAWGIWILLQHGTVEQSRNAIFQFSLSMVIGFVAGVAWWRAQQLSRREPKSQSVHPRGTIHTNL
jgi:hypothetical protein